MFSSKRSALAALRIGSIAGEYASNLERIIRKDLRPTDARSLRCGVRIS